MDMSLENWLRNKLQESEEYLNYCIATDTIRCWIDEYNLLTNKKQTNESRNRTNIYS